MPYSESPTAESKLSRLHTRLVSQVASQKSDESTGDEFPQTLVGLSNTNIMYFAMIEAMTSSLPCCCTRVTKLHRLTWDHRFSMSLMQTTKHFPWHHLLHHSCLHRIDNSTVRSEAYYTQRSMVSDHGGMEHRQRCI